MDAIITHLSCQPKRAASFQTLSSKLGQIAELLTQRHRDLLDRRSSATSGSLLQPASLPFPTTIKQYAIDLEESRKVFEFYAKLNVKEQVAKKWSNLQNEQPAKTESTRAFEVVREPIGLVGLITSFNYPLLLLSWKLAPALLAGNRVIVKPAPQASNSTVDLINEINARDIFGKDVLQVVTGGSDVGQSLVQDPRIDKISFTGSTQAGRMIARSCGENLKPCTLELGGKNACIVFADADIDQAVASIVDGAFSNMGQNCCGLSRLLIHKDIYNQVVERIKEATSKLVIGDPADWNTDIGPVIDRQAYIKITNLINLALSDPNLSPKSGNYWIPPLFASPSTAQQRSSSYESSLIVPPTIFTNVPITHTLSQTEAFGPILAIHPPFESFEQAIDDLNSVSHSTGYGLASGCFTSSLATAQAFSQATESGMVWINMWNECDPSVPFGGFKNSGLGKELGMEGFLSFTRQKSIVTSI